MEPIDFQHRTRLVFGAGSISRLGELASELGVRRALVVSDGGVVAAGHHQTGVEALRSCGLEVASFLEVHENPSTSDVQGGVKVAQDFRPDVLIGLGGGSSMDCAKGINFLHSCGGKMEDYWGVGKATGEMLPLIAIPTTAGTGSEAQSFALISQDDTHKKMACGDARAAARVAILDPQLTLTQPNSVTCLTGIDAVSHALESYVTRRRNPLSVSYSRQAWRLLSSGLPAVIADPQDLEARSEMQLGAFFAGLAIETSMLGAAHALANPLTAHYGVVHGQAVGMMLPQVIRFNSSEVGEWYSELWRDVAHNELGKQCAAEDKSDADKLAAYVCKLLEGCGMQTDLNQIGIRVESLDTLAEDATTQWTGTFNPRQLTRDDFHQIYLDTFGRREAG